MVEKKIAEKLDRLKAFCSIPASVSWNNYEVLKTAIQCEQKDVALLLLNADCRVNSESDVIENTALHYAVRLEDTEIIQVLISKGALLTCQNQKGDTPLHVAAMSRNVEILDLLLDNMESTKYVNPVNNFGLTHMHIACMRDKPDIVEKFLKNGVGKDIPTNLDSPFWPGYTPLHFAVEFCCLDVVQLLMKHDADGKCKDAKGTDPYYLSFCKYQYASMVNYFMHLKYDERRQDAINFHVACLEGDERIVDQYLKHGASCTGHLYDYCIFENDTPLHCAARSESIETVQLLLKKNPDLYSVNEFGMTPLHAALYQEANHIFPDKNYKRTVEILYPAYDFKNNKNVTDKNGMSFLHIICSQGDNESIKYLLEQGIDINSQVEECGGHCWFFKGYTPLYFAVYYRQASTVKLLLQCGADITKSINEHDHTPFDYAITYKYKDVIKAIIESGLDLSTVRKKNGQNLFHRILSDYEPENDNRSIIKMFYENGCNVNGQSINGNTPLHEANHTNAINIKAVLNLGADINIENIKGETPLTSLRNYELSEHIHIYVGTDFLKSYAVYISHVEKLKAIGFYVNEKNILMIQQIFEELTQLNSDRLCLNLQSKYKNQIEKMKRTKVSNYSSLYDILFADANQMAFHCNSQAFLNIMNLKNSDDQFPSYRYLLRLQLNKGKERRALLKPAKKALKFILRGELPDFCSEKVFSYLSDDDLKTISNITSENYIRTKELLKISVMLEQITKQNDKLLNSMKSGQHDIESMSNWIKRMKS